MQCKPVKVTSVSVRGQIWNICKCNININNTGLLAGLIAYIRLREVPVDI